MAGFRLSQHKLRIEIDRHNHGVRIPPEHRICRMCTTSQVEDEYHIFNCPAYRILRQEWNIPTIVSVDMFRALMSELDVNIQVYICKTLHLQDRHKGVFVT